MMAGDQFMRGDDPDHGVTVIPGHHYQYTVKLLTRPSRIRRNFFTSQYVEGWAFYCEQLLREHDYYAMEDQLFQLRMIAWRAARAVIDPSLHIGWTNREDAVALLIDAAGFTRSTAESEVNRFLDTPTQAVCYLMGYREILRLRNDLRAREGAAFDIAQFHDRFLRFGPVPVGLTRTVMLGERGETK
jgi:uncharacterized protein (DUF885 family)